MDFLKGKRSLLVSLPTLAGNLSNLFLNRQDGNAPYSVGWNLSNRCDSKCLHCKYYTEVSDNALSKAERRLVARDIQMSGVKFVSLLGREPLLVDDLFGLIRILNERGDKYINITTNGSRLLERLDELLETPPSALTISLDGASAETHDKIRGNPGLFQRIENAISEIRRREFKPLLMLRFTIMKQNVGEMEAFYSRFRDRVDHISFQPVQDNAIHCVRSDDVMKKDAEDCALLKQSLKRLSQLDSEFRKKYYELLPDFMYAPEKFVGKRRVRCLLNSSAYVAIMPDGGVYPCERFRHEQAVGYVPQESIEDIWKRPEMFERQRQMRTSSECTCWTYNQWPNVWLQRPYNLSGR